MDELHHKRLAGWGATERARDIEAAYYRQMELLAGTLRPLKEELEELQAGGQTDKAALRDYLSNACKGLGRMAAVLQLLAYHIDSGWSVEGWLTRGEEEKIAELNQSIRMRRLRESFGDCAEDFIRRT